MGSSQSTNSEIVSKGVIKGNKKIIKNKKLISNIEKNLEISENKIQKEDEIQKHLLKETRDNYFNKLMPFEKDLLKENFSEEKKRIKNIIML